MFNPRRSSPQRFSSQKSSPPIYPTPSPPTYPAFDLLRAEDILNEIRAKSHNSAYKLCE